MSSSSRSPRLFCPLPLALRMRTLSPTSSNSTSLFGCNPSFSRISIGIVTCPLTVILMVILRKVLLCHEPRQRGQQALELRVIRRSRHRRSPRLERGNRAFEIGLTLRDWIVRGHGTRLQERRARHFFLLEQRAFSRQLIVLIEP